MTTARIATMYDRMTDTDSYLPYELELMHHPEKVITTTCYGIFPHASLIDVQYAGQGTARLCLLHPCATVVELIAFFVSRGASVVLNPTTRRLMCTSHSYDRVCTWLSDMWLAGE